MLTEYFWTFLTGAALAFLYKCLFMLYKSKCTDVSFLGCIIKRNVQAEEEIDRQSAQHDNGSTPVDVV